MVTYLTSDKDIQKTFLRDELAPRLAEMLLCVLKQLVSFVSPTPFPFVGQSLLFMNTMFGVVFCFT